VIRDLDVRMVPGFTIAAMPVTWPSGTPASADASPAYRVIAMLAIDGPAPIAPSNFADARTGVFTPTARAAKPAVAE